MTTAPSWLRDGELHPMARALAALAWRSSSHLDPEVAAARAGLAALLVVERADGHGAIHVDDWGRRDAHPDLPGVPLPDGALWKRALHVDGWIGDGSTPTPLVVRSDGSVSLYRDDRAERELARRLRVRVRPSDRPPPSDALARHFRAIFDASEATGAALAGAVALRSGLTIVTGGPGTGKTTAVVRILALLLLDDPTRRVAVAAPTGKAAARLQESIVERRDELDIDETIRTRLSVDVSTVHRLLGYRPGDESFAYDARRRLPFDVVVVDEASMLDTGLAHALVGALSDDARLVLLGDRDQLASVDAGAVLSDLVDARSTRGDARSPKFARWAAPLFDAAPSEDEACDPLADAVVELRENFRFRGRRSIVTLADAVRDAESALALDTLAAADDVERLDPPAGSLADLFESVFAPTLQAATDDEARLRAVESGVRVLAATRRGRWGVEGLNAAVESWLHTRFGTPVHDRWYPGRPVLIRRNVPGLHLSNGDVGVCVRDPESDAPLCLLRDPEGGTRRLPVSRLPEHETAWAMTVHKAQGSEFDHVVLVLPDVGHPLLTRALLYTGITRARRSVRIVGTAEAVRAAVEVGQVRRTALARRLAADDTDA